MIETTSIYPLVLSFDEAAALYQGLKQVGICHHEHHCTSSFTAGPYGITIYFATEEKRKYAVKTINEVMDSEEDE